MVGGGGIGKGGYVGTTGNGGGGPVGGVVLVYAGGAGPGVGSGVYGTDQTDKQQKKQVFHRVIGLKVFGGISCLERGNIR